MFVVGFRVCGHHMNICKKLRSCVAWSETCVRFCWGERKFSDTLKIDWLIEGELFTLRSQTVIRKGDMLGISQTQNPASKTGKKKKTWVSFSRFGPYMASPKWTTQWQGKRRKLSESQSAISEARSKDMKDFPDFLETPGSWGHFWHFWCVQ